MTNPLKFWRELGRVRRDIAAVAHDHQAQIVQSHLLSLYDFILPALKRDVPAVQAIIWTFHNTEFEIRRYDAVGFKTRLYRWLYPRMARQVDAIIAVAPDVKAAILRDFRFPADRVTVIENAIPVNAYRVNSHRVPQLRAAFCAAQGLPLDAPILLSVGRLTEQKGHATLLGAFEALNFEALNGEACICIAGDGPLIDDLRARADALKPVRLLGRREDIADLLAICDLFVLPSLWEGLPQALIEAMAAGKPIVATDIPGVNRVLSDGATGRLVPPGDHMALARAIRDCLDDPEQSAVYGRAAYQLARDRYDISRLVADHLALFDRI